MSAWFNAAINFVLMPIITRVVSPAELGQIDMFITFCTMFVYASTLGMHQAYMRFFNDRLAGLTKENILAIAVKYSSVGAFIATIICFISANYFSKSILGVRNFSIVLLMAIYIFATGFIAICKTKPRMYGNTFIYTVLVIAESLTIKLSYLSVTITNSVFFSICILVILVLIIMIICAVKNRRDILCTISSIPFQTKKILLLYALPTVPVMFLSNINTSLPKIFLNKYFGSSLVGIYSGCLTIVSIITLVQAGMNVFWGPYVFENYKTQQKQIQTLHQAISFFIVFCGLGLLAIQDIIYYILGSEYRFSREFYALLLCSPIFYTIGETVGIGINIKKKTYWNIVTTSIALFSNLMLCYLLIPKYGNLGAAIAVAISSVVMLLIKAFIGERYYTVVATPLKTIMTITIYIVGAIISITFNKLNVIRNILIILLMLILVILYRKEIEYFIKQLRIKGYEETEND
ncbi:lipopolysaccharide biosynthesis protein [Lachnoclostridium pacaense]|uniref:lipopolysaccharide biosynthesis protein n=1 Tax=Enterocloster hominis (ex Hitch et al. 2024) TaxID=1917870 RepID=UPI001D12F139|nr:lipopolysaccharide biosynthesis protein [Lachnoclostridium pacaense]MCC2820949.1 lipopolysaccharide biosynthesis protein [Lachnoclostridium pacaense]